MQRDEIATLRWSCAMDVKHGFTGMKTFHSHAYVCIPSMSNTGS